MDIVQHKKVTWIDFENPTDDDITYLQENFNIHPLAIEELVTPTYQPKVVQYDGCLFLSIHIPLFDVEHRTTYPGELDIILTADHLITSHRRSIYQLNKFFKDLEKSTGKRRESLEKTPTHLLHDLIEVLLDSCFPRLNHISEKLDFIETQVFAEKEKEMVFEISVLKRDILNFRRTLKPQRSILESVIQKNHRPFPQQVSGGNDHAHEVNEDRFRKLQVRYFLFRSPLLAPTPALLHPPLTETRDCITS